ncbi:MAG: pyridoxal phosphate-dependent aminotransferase [Oscillospiraceae bacterium]|nr:pyridoxal phosphate-dependent aminotransferase [Oscillospiraceae bacterium]
MLPENMLKLGLNRSAIRELFEYGKKRSEEIGKENVFDFSIGNPSIPAPECLTKALKELLENEDPVLLHGYSSAQGDAGVRAAIAKQLNEDYGAGLSADNLYMTCGAAASLCISLKAVLLPGEEVLTFAPHFPEYKVFAEGQGGVFKAIEADREHFQIDFEKLEKAVTEKTRAVIINSPNNPSGVVYSRETLEKLAALLRHKQEEYKREIYLISDEPYRELVYDKETEVPYVPAIYANTLVCYSYSKSLSLPGERIGYIAVPDSVKDSRNVYASVCGAGRALGYVCAPTLFQKAAAMCTGKTADIDVYRKNRDMLYGGLKNIGYECVKPDGAFYLFVKALEENAEAFCENAKKYELLLVPGDSFGCTGYVRVSYCVAPETIERALPAFGKLFEEYAARGK